MRPIRKPLTPSCGEGPDFACRLVGCARLGRIDVLVLGGVHVLRWVGREHETPAVAHPDGVDLNNARVFPPEVLSPGKEVAMGAGAGGSGHGLICPMRSIFRFGVVQANPILSKRLEFC